MVKIGAELPKLSLRNDLYCVEWGVKLYSLTPKIKLGIRFLDHPVKHSSVY